VSLRLPNETAERLRAWARRAGRSVSEVGALSLEEWLRQQEFADIEFRAFGGERLACLKGGPRVWKIIEVAQGYSMDAERTAAHFDWPVHRVQAVFNYYAAYPDEIDRIIEENRSITFDQLKRLLPQIEVIAVPRSATESEEPG
jgi:hypothetical protein